jgi:hypothetical protein
VNPTYAGMKWTVDPMGIMDVLLNHEMGNLNCIFFHSDTLSFLSSK